MAETKYERRTKICVSGAAEVSHCNKKIVELGKEIGRQIAKAGAVLLTGATTGVPYYAAQGYKEAGGEMSVGFSPAGSKSEHLNTYHLPVDQFDLIIYTGFDYVGRNLILMKSADGVVLACGRTGTLNEFTVAYETRTPVAVLEGSGGTADMIESILKRGHKSKKNVTFDDDPEKLLKKLLNLIKKNS